MRKLRAAPFLGFPRYLFGWEDTGPMSNDFEYDVFLSHSSKDKLTVRELAERLKADGVRVWLDEWEIRPGDLLGLETEQR